MFVVVATIFEIVALVFLFLKQCRDTEGKRSPISRPDFVFRKSYVYKVMFHHLK